MQPSLYNVQIKCPASSGYRESWHLSTDHPKELHTQAVSASRSSENVAPFEGTVGRQWGIVGQQQV